MQAVFPRTWVRSSLVLALSVTDLYCSSSSLRQSELTALGNKQNLLDEWNAVFKWQNPAVVQVGDNILLAVSPNEWKQFIDFFSRSCPQNRRNCEQIRSVWWRFPVIVVTDTTNRQNDNLTLKAFDSHPGHWDWRFQPRPTSKRSAKIKTLEDDAIVVDALAEASSKFGYQISDTPLRFGRGSSEFIRLHWKFDGKLEVESQAIFVIDTSKWMDETSIISITPILLGCHLRFASEPWSRCRAERRKAMLDELDKIVEQTIIILSEKEEK